MEMESKSDGAVPERTSQNRLGLIRAIQNSNSRSGEPGLQQPVYNEMVNHARSRWKRPVINDATASTSIGPDPPLQLYVPTMNLLTVEQSTDDNRISRMQIVAPLANFSPIRQDARVMYNDMKMK